MAIWKTSENKYHALQIMSGNFHLYQGSKLRFLLYLLAYDFHITLIQIRGNDVANRKYECFLTGELRKGNKKYTK